VLLVSCLQDDFIWNQEEIDFMKEQHLLDKTNNRKRDNFTRYVEAAAAHNKLLKAAAGMDK